MFNVIYTHRKAQSPFLPTRVAVNVVAVYLRSVMLARKQLKQTSYNCAKLRLKIRVLYPCGERDPEQILPSFTTDHVIWKHGCFV